MALEHFRLDGLSLTGHGDGLTNLVSNPSFEVDTAGWSTTLFSLNSGATLTRDATVADVGVASGKVVTTAASSAQGACIACPTITFQSGVTYVASVRLRGNAGGETITVQFGATATDVASVAATLTTSFQTITVLWTPNANRSGATHGVAVRTASAAVRTFFIDAVIVMQGSTLGTYFDGDTPGYSWTGTAHASTSVSSPFEVVEAPAFTPAPQRLDWVGGPDTDGTVPLDRGHGDNATLTIPLRVVKQATADAAWSAVGALLSKLEACRASPDGLTLVWSPRDMTESWVLTIHDAAIAEAPMASRGDTSGYLLRAPLFTIVMACAPFLYKQGETVDFTEVTSTEPVFSITLDDVPGHVDAEATVTITDNASQARRHVEWGLGDGTSGNLLIDSASLATSGFAGSSTTRTGAYSSSGVIRATLATQPQAVCGTGNLTHLGAHRAYARVWATGTDVRMRLAYRVGNGPYSYTPWQPPVLEDDFCEVAFGVISLGRVIAGTQQWDGRIEAYSMTIGDTIDVDYLLVLPVERWGKARGQYAYRAGLLVARDEFTSITAGTALNARSAPLGGSWTTSGATTDLAAADAPTDPSLPIGAGNPETMARTAVSDSVGPYSTYRLARLGSTDYTNVEVGVDFYSTVNSSAVTHLVGARYVDSNNLATLEYSGGVLALRAVVAGAVPALATTAILVSAGAWYSLRIVAYATGGAFGALISDGAVIATIGLAHSSLATGGTLATGRPLFADRNSSATAASRYYDNFYVATPATEPLAINSGRALLVRHNSCDLQSSDAATYGPPAAYTGALALVPPAGAADRTTRLWCKARRVDINVAADANIADSTKLDVSLRPRYRLPVRP